MKAKANYFFILIPLLAFLVGGAVLLIAYKNNKDDKLVKNSCKLTQGIEVCVYYDHLVDNSGTYTVHSSITNKSQKTYRKMANLGCAEPYIKTVNSQIFGPTSGYCTIKPIGIVLEPNQTQKFQVVLPKGNLIDGINSITLQWQEYESGTVTLKYSADASP